MESSQGNVEVSTENPVTSAAIEPLLNLALGASEEVNTTSNSKGNIGKRSYLLRSKTTNANNEVSKDATESFSHIPSTPLNSPIVSCSSTSLTQNSTAEEPQNVNDLVRVVSANEVDINPVFSGENLHLVHMQEDTNLTNESGENAEANPIPGGFVVIEQSVLEQISGFLKSAVAMQSNSVAKLCNQVTETSSVGTSTNQVLQDEVPNSTTNCTPQNDSKTTTDTANQQLIPTDEDEWIDTKATALQLTDELRRYHIPQAVFARKILNRSQGTLSDILRKPKPWNEMKLGKEIFRKMKEWLSLPEVKRIPQLRTEGNV